MNIKYSIDSNIIENYNELATPSLADAHIDYINLNSLAAIAKQLVNTSNINIPAPLNINNNMILNSDSNGSSISSQNKLTLTGGDSVYILNKSGLIISKSNQGSGNLQIEGNIIMGDSVLDSSTLSDMLFWFKNRNNLFINMIKYNNIYDSIDNGVVSKQGNPKNWDDTSFTINKLWNKKPMIRIGLDSSYPDGMIVNIPSGYDTMWLQVINDRWCTINIKTSSGKKICTYGSGRKSLVSLSPDGTVGIDGVNNAFVWIPINIKKLFVDNKCLITAGTISSTTDVWISNIAFSNNVWGYTNLPATVPMWGCNGEVNKLIIAGDKSGEWHGGLLVKTELGKQHDIYVPIVQTGRDKLVYIIEHNNDWAGTYHTDILANGQNVGRLKSTYSNLISTHYNSKIYSRYLAVKVEKELINKDDTFIKITLSTPDTEIYFREIGSHDYI